MVGYAMMRYYLAHQGTWCMYYARCVQAGTRTRIHSIRRSISIPAAAASSQNVTLPVIPELYSPNFLDALLPIKDDAASPAEPQPLVESDDGTVELGNTLMDALTRTVHRTFTENGAPAYASTTSPTLDAFQALCPRAHGANISRYLGKAWEEDPELTLRIIWNSRSIHDGKGEREVFYQ